jgi:hypothetical protein
MLYKKEEKIGFDKLEQLIKTQSPLAILEEGPNFEMGWDVMVSYPIQIKEGGVITNYTIDNKQVYIKHIYEIKVRNITHNQYNTILLEKRKYDEMMKAAFELKAIPFFIVFFSDNYYAKWNLYNMPILPEISKILTNVNTVRNTYEKVRKDFFELQLTTQNTKKLQLQ